MGLTIGFDATPLLGQRTGVGKYTSRLLAALLKEKPEWRFLLFSNKPIEPFEQDLIRSSPIYHPRAKKRLLWMHLVLPYAIRQSQPQLCHFPNAMAPLRQQKPFVMTIHDASLFLHSEHHPLARILSIRLTLPHLARRASAVITVSNDARDDLIRLLKLPPEKIHVVYEAASSEFKPVSDLSMLDSLRSKYALPDQFLLFVGTLESRKNLVRLVRAFDMVRRAGISHRLVIAGSPGWMSDKVVEEIERLELEDDVCLTGYVPDEDLPGLLSLSDLFVFPSLFEGFGLPTLEAMSCGTPVVTSNVSSMPEVSGDAAHYVNPEDEASIAEGVMSVLQDREYQRELSRRGLARAKLFSWQRTARETIQIYEKVLNAAG